jgi:hypothetical protein
MYRFLTISLSIWTGCGAGIAPTSSEPADASSTSDLGVSGTIQHADLGWTDLASPPKDMTSPLTTTALPPGTTVTGIWGTGPDNLYIATNASTNAVYHIGPDGMLQAQAVSGGLRGVTGSDAQHIWAISIASVVFSAGDGNWALQSPFDDPQFLYVTGIWAASPNDIYATGVRNGGFGAIYHSAGDGTWSAQQATGTRMYGVWGRSNSDVYAVGGSGQVFHTTGDGTWSDLSKQFYGGFTSVWGNATDLFIAGPPIYRSHSGGAWTIDATSGTETWDIRGMWGSASDNVWIVGTGGLLLHRDASGWSRLYSGTTSDLFAVWGTDASHVWIGGANVLGQLH